MKKRILSFALAFVMILSLLPATAQAAMSSGTCGTNARWTLNSAGTLTISGTGSMKSYSSGNTPWKAHSAGIKKVVIQSGITSTGSNAFAGCTNLTAVTLPSTLTTIGTRTFYGCSSLTTVTLPSKLKSIGSYAFGGCTKLSKATLPTSLQTIGTYAFYNCKALTTVTIPTNVKTLSASAFSQCKSLASVTLPAGLTSIGKSAFLSCSKLKTVNFKGTSAQWKKVTINSGNTVLNSATMKYGGTTSTAKTYTVTFNANSGTLPASAQKTKTVTNGGTYGTLPTPTRNGYTFSGWYTTQSSGGTRVTAASKVSLTGNQTLYARWSGKKYTVTFNANSGTLPASAQKTKPVTNGGTYGTLPTPTYTGYTFDGWYTTKSGTGTKITNTSKVNLTGNQTLYARWTKNSTSPASYTVTFNANGGTLPASAQKTKPVTNGGTYGTLPTPTYTGYTFDGWYTTKSGTGTKITNTSKVNLTGNQTLYAHWTKEAPAAPYTVYFNANGGTAGSSSKTVTNGKPYGELAIAIRKGFTFDGWYTAAEGGTKITADSIVNLTGNQMLYAHWSAGKYTVEFDANGGTVTPSSIPVTNGGTYGTLPTPTRSGHTFDGWYTAANGGTEITAASKVNLTGNQTLYAHWSSALYTELTREAAMVAVDRAHRNTLTEDLVLVYYSTGCGYCATYVPQYKSFTAAEGIPMAGYADENGSLNILWQYGYLPGTIGWPVVVTYNATTKTVKCNHSVRSLDAFKQVLADNGLYNK